MLIILLDTAATSTDMKVTVVCTDRGTDSFLGITNGLSDEIPDM